jgi:hypothetical protein
MTPGPLAAMQTLGFCVSRLQAFPIIAAACSWRTSMGFIPSFMQSPSASIMGPPIKKKRCLVPSFFRDFAKISDPDNIDISYLYYFW